MGDAPVGASQLTTLDCDGLAATLKTWGVRDERILGNLAHLREHLSSIEFDLGLGTDYGEPDFDLDALAVTGEAVRTQVKRLLKAAAELRALMPPEPGEAGFLQARVEHPWLDSLDHFDGAIADLYDDGGAQGREYGLNVAARIRRAVDLLDGIHLPLGKPGPTARTDVPHYVVRATVYFLAELGIHRYWWGEAGISPPDKRDPRRDQAPLPTTDIGLLIAAVADAVGLGDTSNAQLKECLRVYHQQLKAEARDPLPTDFRSKLIT